MRVVRGTLVCNVRLTPIDPTAISTVRLQLVDCAVGVAARWVSPLTSEGLQPYVDPIAAKLLEYGKGGI